MQDLAQVSFAMCTTCEKNNTNFQRIFPRFLPGGIFKIVKSRYTTSIALGATVN